MNLAMATCPKCKSKFSALTDCPDRYAIRECFNCGCPISKKDIELGDNLHIDEQEKAMSDIMEERFMIIKIFRERESYQRLIDLINKRFVTGDYRTGDKLFSEMHGIDIF